MDNFNFNSRSITEAIRKRALKGLRVSIITNGVHETSAGSVSLFAKGHQKHWVELNLPTVKQFIYKVAQTMYHKKVTLSGKNHALITSSNGGTKSMGNRSLTGCDYELGFLIDSPEVVEDFRLSHQEDETHCIPVDIKHAQKNMNGWESWFQRRFFSHFS